jgi:hypothetical protein
MNINKHVHHKNEDTRDEATFYCCYCDNYSAQTEAKHLSECNLFQKLVPLVKNHPRWKEEIFNFRTV